MTAPLRRLFAGTAAPGAGRELLLRRGDRRLAQILEAQRELSELEPDLDAALQRLVERAAEITGADGARLFERDGDVLRAGPACGSVGAGTPLEELPVDGSLAGLAARTGEVQTTRDVASDERAYRGPSPTRSAIFVPIGSPGGVRFVLGVVYTRPDGFEDEDVEAALLMAEFAGTALRNAGELRARRDLLDALGESEHRFRAAIESSPIGFALCDLDDHYLIVNDAFCRIVDRTPAELEGLTWRELTHPDDMGADQALTSRLFTGDLPHFEIEKRMLRPDGEVRWVRMLVALSRSADGKPLYGVAQTEDITGERQLERSVRDSERLFRAAFEQSLVAMNIFDDDGRVLDANDVACGLARLEYDQLIGRRLAEFAPDGDGFRPVLEEMLASGEATGEAEIVTAAGERLTIEYLLRANVRPGRHLGVFHDVTEQRRLEERLRDAQKMEAVGRLAGGIAHDFNNMLTAINGYAELLLAKLQEDDPLHRHAFEIQQAGTRAASLTKQLLAFSRRQVLKPAVLDLGEAVERMRDMLQRLVGEDVVIETRHDRQVEPVLVDESQLQQVVVNLAANARDAMPSGGLLRIETATVTVDPEQAREAIATPGRYTRLAISDTGVGIDAEQVGRLWEPFYSTKGDAGVGLGLATVYGIVRQSGGFLDVETSPGAGSTFRVFLPVTSRRSEPRAPEEPEPEQRASGTVLLVEDEEVVRGIVGEMLEQNGYRVLTAAGGTEAVRMAAAEEEPIDLLVTDVVMPGLSGQEVARRVAERWPGVRTLFVSGYNDSAIRNHGVLAPGTFFLQKPFTTAELARKLREVAEEAGA